MFVVLRLQDGCEGMNTLKVVLCEECTPRVQPLTLQSQLITKVQTCYMHSVEGCPDVASWKAAGLLAHVCR